MIERGIAVRPYRTVFVVDDGQDITISQPLRFLSTEEEGEEDEAEEAEDEDVEGEEDDVEGEGGEDVEDEDEEGEIEEGDTKTATGSTR